MLDLAALDVLPSDALGLIQDFVGRDHDQMVQCDRVSRFIDTMLTDIVSRCQTLANQYEATGSAIVQTITIIPRFVTKKWIIYFIESQSMAPNAFNLFNALMLKDLACTLEDHIVSAYNKFCNTYVELIQAAVDDQIQFSRFTTPNGFVSVLERLEKAAYIQAVDYLRDHNDCFDWTPVASHFLNYVPFAFTTRYDENSHWMFEVLVQSFPSFVRIRGDTYLDCAIHPHVAWTCHFDYDASLYDYFESRIYLAYAHVQDTEIVQVLGFEDNEFEF